MYEHRKYLRAYRRALAPSNRWIMSYDNVDADVEEYYETLDLGDFDQRWLRWLPKKQLGSYLAGPMWHVGS